MDQPLYRQGYPDAPQISLYWFPAIVAHASHDISCNSITTLTFIQSKFTSCLAWRRGSHLAITSASTDWFNVSESSSARSCYTCHLRNCFRIKGPSVWWSSSCLLEQYETHLYCWKTVYYQYPAHLLGRQADPSLYLTLNLSYLLTFSHTWLMINACQTPTNQGWLPVCKNLYYPQIWCCFVIFLSQSTFIHFSSLISRAVHCLHYFRPLVINGVQFPSATSPPVNLANGVWLKWLCWRPDGPAGHWQSAKFAQ